MATSVRRTCISTWVKDESSASSIGNGHTLAAPSKTLPGLSGSCVRIIRQRSRLLMICSMRRAFTYRGTNDTRQWSVGADLCSRNAKPPAMSISLRSGGSVFSAPKCGMSNGVDNREDPSK